jgi:hypothetical protein
VTLGGSPPDDCWAAQDEPAGPTAAGFLRDDYLPEVEADLVLADSPLAGWLPDDSVQLDSAADGSVAGSAAQRVDDRRAAEGWGVPQEVRAARALPTNFQAALALEFPPSGSA